MNEFTLVVNILKRKKNPKSCTKGVQKTYKRCTKIEFFNESRHLQYKVGLVQR